MKMTEFQLQIAVVEYCIAKKIPCIHIPNEGKRSKSFGQRLKRMGLTKGVSDLFIMHPQGKKFGLWMELKATGKKPTIEQWNWFTNVRAYGYESTYVDNIDMAMKIIDEYIK